MMTCLYSDFILYITDAKIPRLENLPQRRRTALRYCIRC